MNNQISQKLSAVAMAIIMNAAIIGGVAYLFSKASEQHTYAQRYERHEGGTAAITACASQVMLGAHRLTISI